ncbi:hypothetical protein RB195_025519 [Necator americanus]
MLYVMTAHTALASSVRFLMWIACTYPAIRKKLSTGTKASFFSKGRLKESLGRCRRDSNRTGFGRSDHPTLRSNFLQLSDTIKIRKADFITRHRERLLCRVNW